MSRIAVQGDPGGLGIVTVKAPNTEDSYALELPPSGGTLARAAAGGMPLLDDGTPVVESGSNSDGYWTRLSEGTVFMHAQITLDDNNSGGKLFQLPTSVISIDSSGPPVVLANSASSGGTASSRVCEAFLATTTTYRAKALTHAATTVTDPGSIVGNMSLTGRWK